MSGLFGKILGGLEGSPDGTTPAGSGNLVSELIANAGGIGGLMSKFGQAGMGDKVQSWVGTGQNLPMVASEVLKVFPQDQIEALAEKHGVPAGMVTQVLAHLLPQAVDQATPDGSVPPAAGQADQGWA